MQLASVKTQTTTINGYQVKNSINLYQWSDGTLELTRHETCQRVGHNIERRLLEVDPNGTVSAALALLADELKAYGAQGIELLSRFTSRLQADISGTPNQPLYCLVGAFE